MKRKVEEVEDNVIPFRKAVSDEPPGSGKNWVSKFEQGTRFLAKRKSDAGSKLDDFVLMTDPKTLGGVLLGENMNTRDGGVYWRDPEIFSNDYRFYVIIEILEPNDGNNSKVHSGSVASDGQSEDVDSLHEEK